MKNTVLALYQSPGVESGLLELQDSQGISIPLLLWGAWLCTEGKQLACLPALEVERLLLWEADTVALLRGLRRSMKAQLVSEPSLAALRDQIKACEQQAEWWLLERLARLALEPGNRCPLELCAEFAGCGECEPIGALRAAVRDHLNSQHQVG